MNGTEIKLAPPGMGSYAIPPVQQAVAIFNAGVSKVYRNPDEAYITDRQQAEVMLTDLNIQEPLSARMLATTLLPWHIEPEDKSDPEQRLVAAALQRDIENIPELHKLYNSLLWAIWYGTAGTQLAFRFHYYKGRRHLCVDSHSPVHGDSIRWRWDKPGKIMIQVFAGQLGEGTDNLDWVSTDVGPAHPLNDQEREQFIIHRHQLMGYAYFSPQKSGLTQGCGLRNFIWWSYRTKAEMLAFLTEYLERHGTGFYLGKFPFGNADAQAIMEQIALGQSFQQVVTLPQMPDNSPQFSLERVAPDTAGVKNLMDIIEYYNAQVRRYISGNDVKADGDVTIIGQDNSHENAFSRITRYDALNLADTLTHQLVRVMQRWTFPETEARFKCKFVFNVDRPQPEKFMQAANLFWQMGGAVDEDQLRNELRLSKPTEGSSILQQPQQQQAPPMDQGGNGFNPFSGEEPGATPQLPTPGRSEGEWEQGQGPEGGELQFNTQTGAVRYSKLETYAAEDWNQIEDGPRGGKRWKNKNTGKIVRSDPTKGKGRKPGATPAKPKGDTEGTIREATIAFTEKDQEALENVVAKLKAVKGQRGGLGVTGLQAIARAIGLKPGKLKKDQLVEALVEKLGVAKKEAPQANFQNRIDKAKEAQRVTGIPFLDRLAGQILGQKRDPDYQDAILDIQQNGHDKKGNIVRRPEAENTIKRLKKQVIDQLINDADANLPTRELKHALDSIKAYGELTPAEAIDLALERGNLDKVSPPDKAKGGILPDEIDLRKTRKPGEKPEKRKERDYIDHVLRPRKARERHIKAIEKKTGTPFLSRVVNRVINEHILSPIARQKYEQLRAKIQKEGIPAEKLPEKEARFFQDYEAGQEYKRVQSKISHHSGDYFPSARDHETLNGFKAAILSRVAFDDGYTFNEHDLSNILEDLDQKGFGALKVNELLGKAKDINPATNRDKYRKGK